MYRDQRTKGKAIYSQRNSKKLPYYRHPLKQCAVLTSKYSAEGKLKVQKIVYIDGCMSVYSCEIMHVLVSYTACMRYFITAW